MSSKISRKEVRLSRREVLKGTGALVVSFNLFGPVSHALAQLSAGPDLAGEISPETSRRLRLIPGSP
jgi:hypothetical protein